MAMGGIRGALQVLGQSAKTAGANQAVRSTANAAPGFMGLLKDSFKESLPSAIVSTVVASPYYLTAYDPVQGLGMAALDTLGSTAVSSLLNAGVTRMLPRKYATAVNPEYEAKLKLLGVEPSATPQQIDAAKLAARQKILKEYPDISETAGKTSTGAAKIREVTEAARALKAGVSPADMFIQQPVPSHWASGAGTIGDMAFSFGLMPQVEQALSNAGLVTNKFNVPQTQGQGQTSQADIINQQLDSRVAQGDVRTSELSPGTMYQDLPMSGSNISAADSYAIMDQLMRQAMGEQADIYGSLGIPQDNYYTSDLMMG